MRKIVALIVPVLAFALSGCIVQSLQPLYRDQDVVFQPELVGRWSDKDGGDIWEFAKSDDNVYAITLTESGGDRGVFEGRLVKLGQTLFLDLTADDMKTPKVAALYNVHLLPIHSFVRVDRLTPAPTLTPLDYDWMTDLLTKTPGELRHEMVGPTSDTHVVLTASTLQLQAFIQRHAANSAAFKKPIELEAVKRQ